MKISDILRNLENYDFNKNNIKNGTKIFLLIFLIYFHTVADNNLYNCH